MVAVICTLALTAGFLAQNGNAATADQQVPVVFKGGYQTDPRDHGRPVVLIAAALGVASEVFRKAFSNVHPARPGQEPEPSQVRQNKEVLLRALGSHGITNDRLDTVSNYYRYNASRGEMWRNSPAKATATIHDGKVTAVTITDAGAGYSSTPEISVPGIADFKATVSVGYGTDFKKNGSIKEIKLN